MLRTVKKKLINCDQEIIQKWTFLTLATLIPNTVQPFPVTVGSIQRLHHSNTHLCKPQPDQNFKQPFLLFQPYAAHLAQSPSAFQQSPLQQLIDLGLLNCLHSEAPKMHIRGSKGVRVVSVQSFQMMRVETGGSECVRATFPHPDEVAQNV